MNIQEVKGFHLHLDKEMERNQMNIQVVKKDVVQYSGLGHEKNHKNIQKAKKHSIYNGQ
jgi:hypothetical protein